MENNKIDPVLEEVCADIADFTVGFAIVRTSGGAEDADPAGSGTLVAVGSVHGILTAAHVLKNLPDQGEVGLVRFPRVQSVVAQRTMIYMAQAEKVIVAADNFGPEGPDIGFLRLSPWDASALTARNVFFNLGMRRKAVLAGDQPDSQCFDGVSGMVAEWTTDLPPEEQPPVRVKAFRALFGGL